MYHILKRAMGYRGAYKEEVGIEVIEHLWLVIVHNRNAFEGMIIEKGHNTSTS